MSKCTMYTGLTFPSVYPCTGDVWLSCCEGNKSHKWQQKFRQTSSWQNFVFWSDFSSTVVRVYWICTWSWSYTGEFKHLITEPGGQRWESICGTIDWKKKSGKTQQKQDYHWISFWPSRKKDSRVDECPQPSVISLLYAEPTHININPDGDLRGTISGESPNSRQWRGLRCYMVRVLLTDEQSAYINFISQPIRSSEWKGRREILYGEKMLLLLLFKMNFPIFTIPFLRLMNIVLVLNLLYVLI
jgi:hypothetical protein